MPSAASLSQRDLERLRSLTFFLDYQIGRYVVADALRKAGASVEVHIDHFAPAAPDLEWIPEIGSRRWVLITRDANIRRNPLERAAYEAAGLRGFVVTGKEMGGHDLATLLVRCLQGMVNRAAGRPGPLLFTISRGGVFSKLI
jgi:PIN domain-containing protein